MSDFDKEMGSAKKKIEEALLNTTKETTKAIFNTIIFRTPVGDPEIWNSRPRKDYKPGHLVRNWQASLNTKITSEREGEDPGRTATSSEMEHTIDSMTLKDNPILSNNAPYVEAIEDGHSKQAPVGMVKTTIADFKNILESMARRFKV